MKLSKSRVLLIVLLVAVVLSIGCFNLAYLIRNRVRSHELNVLSTVLEEQAVEHLKKQLESTEDISAAENIIVDNFGASGYSQEIYEANKTRQDSEKEFPYQAAEVYLIVTDNTFFKTNARHFVVRFEKDDAGIMRIIDCYPRNMTADNSSSSNSTTE